MNRYIRPYAEAKAILMERALHQRNPFDCTEPAEAQRLLDTLDTLDHDTWAKHFAAAAASHEERAREAERRGEGATARAEYLLAYGYYRVARYPCMSSPAKREAYVKSQEMYLAAGRYLDPPVEHVAMPFNGRPGEGSEVIGLLRLPKADHPLPLVVAWGGIDSFKEERRVEPFLARGFAGLNVDMPGVADAPIPGSEDAERLWDAVFDWIDTQPAIDSHRVVIWGGSTGGYWAAKLAHTHRQRIAAVLEQGGAIHYAYQGDWIEKAQHGEYPFELAETLARAFGRSTFEEWLDYAPKLSLLTQDILEKPSAPMLCINGLHDSVFPIADQYLLLEHGNPKSARFYDTAHMGHTPRTMADMLDWTEWVLAHV